MQSETDSTASYTQAEDPGDRQDMIAYYVDQILRRITERPYDSIPQLFQHVAWGGPCLSPSDVLRLFGGRTIFRRTCQRMSMVRRAVLNGGMDTIPVDLRTWTEQERPVMDPPYRDYQHYWSPHLDSQWLFWYENEDMREEIYRYPAVLGTDEFFQETDDESCQTDEAVNSSMEESIWFGVMNRVSGKDFWESPDESWLTSTDREEYDDGSDDEEWRQPPPINTTGPEWFYE